MNNQIKRGIAVGALAVVASLGIGVSTASAAQEQQGNWRVPAVVVGHWGAHPSPAVASNVGGHWSVPLSGSLLSNNGQSHIPLHRVFTSTGHWNASVAPAAVSNKDGHWSQPVDHLPL
jgi:hypothetical protein